MGKTANYNIRIKNLDAILAGNGLKVIKDASRMYHLLMLRNIRKFSKTGRLKGSWKFELYDNSSASVYSNLPYARSQDKGAKIKITKKMRNYAWYKYSRTKNKMWKAIAITKKKYIKLPAKGYSKVNLKIIKKFIESKWGK